MTGADVWVAGDVQGHLEPFRRVLHRTGLIDAADHWAGGSATLVVVGDLVDRGPDGIGVVRLLMRLQGEADVRVLIGNHDILLLAAHRFPEFREDFLNGGGMMTDLHALAANEVEWLSGLPAILLLRSTLLVHADSMLYLNYGTTVEEVNAAFGAILGSDDVDPWRKLLDDFSEHRAFLDRANLDRFLEAYSGRMVVHGHTPIARMLHVPAETVTRAYVYQEGRCVNVDPGFYLGGPGFAYSLRSRGTGR